MRLITQVWGCTDQNDIAKNKSLLFEKTRLAEASDKRSNQVTMSKPSNQYD